MLLVRPQRVQTWWTSCCMPGFPHEWKLTLLHPVFLNSFPEKTAVFFQFLKKCFSIFLKIFTYIYVFDCSGSQLQHTASSVFTVTYGIFSRAKGEGHSSLTSDRTQARCTGSAESLPLDHQGSPTSASVSFPAVL